jgi:autotransporter-associated beta strand protein
MATTLVRHWLKGAFSRRGRGTARRPVPFQPHCEALERRDLLTVSWVGLGNPDSAGLRNWFDDANWREVHSGGTLGTFRRPAFREDLVFGTDAPATARATRNGFPQDFEFGRITFEASGYTVAAHTTASPSNRLVLSSSTTNPARMTNLNGATSVINANILLKNDRHTILSSNGGTLRLGGVLSGGAATQELQIEGTGVELGGPSGNLYTNQTWVKGSVTLNKATGQAISGGHLTIGDALGTDTVRLLRGGDQIGNTMHVEIHSRGVLDLNNQSETIGPLGLTGSTVEIGTGALRVNGPIVTRTAAGPARINGSATAGGLVLQPLNAGLQLFQLSNPTDHLVVTARMVGAGGIQKSGVGRLTIGGTGFNTFTGVTEVQAGIVTVQKSSALGAASAGTVVSFGAKLEIGADARLTVAEPLTLKNQGLPGVGVLSVFGAATHTLTGAVTLSSASTFVIIDVGPSTSLVMQGVVDGVNQVIKSGPGRLIVPAGTTHVYPGNTTVSGGTLQVEGTLRSSVKVGSAGVLAGSGTIEGGITVTGTLSPGVDTRVGTLRTRGGVTFSPGSRYEVHLTPTGGDRLLVQGSNPEVILSPLNPLPQLLVNVSGTIAPGTEFRVIERESLGGNVITGRFAGFAGNPTSFSRNGQGFLLAYTAGPGLNDLVIQRSGSRAALDLAFAQAAADADALVVSSNRLDALDPNDGRFPDRSAPAGRAVLSNASGRDQFAVGLDDSAPVHAGATQPSSRRDAFFARFDDTLAIAFGLAEALADEVSP